MREVSDSGKLIYLQDAIKTPLASKIVTSALLNGDSFDSVYEALDDIYDQPREVFCEAVQKVTSMPTADYDGKGLAQLSTDLVDARHIITRYGDGCLTTSYCHWRGSHDEEATRKVEASLLHHRHS